MRQQLRPLCRAVLVSLPCAGRSVLFWGGDVALWYIRIYIYVSWYVVHNTYRTLKTRLVEHTGTRANICFGMYQLETRFARIITTKFGLVLVHGRWTNTVIDGRFKDLHDFEQKGGSSSAAGGYFLDVNKYPDYIKEGTWLMTCPLTTIKLMLICSGSVMTFAPRVSVIVRLSDYTCTLTSTSCGKTSITYAHTPLSPMSAS